MGERVSCGMLPMTVVLSRDLCVCCYCCRSCAGAMTEWAALNGAGGNQKTRGSLGAVLGVGATSTL